MPIFLGHGVIFRYNGFMPRTLPPLNSIRAFEAAARHLSFSRAAEELGVTQGAISKQVLLLEDYIGMRLFERQPGGLELTERGLGLREAVCPAFTMLGDAFDRFSRRAPRSNICRLSTLTSFAAQFLVPRLGEFERRFPHIDLEILTSNRLIDLSREEVDLSVRLGHGHWEGVVSTELCPGRMVPVCTPEYYKRSDANNLQEFVDSARRAQVFSNNEWVKWFEETGLTACPDTDVFIIEDFLVSMQAVIEGQVIALLPELVVRKFLDNGRMMRFSDTDIIVPRTYHIAHKPNADRNPVVRDVIAWLHEEIAKAEISRPE